MTSAAGIMAFLALAATSSTSGQANAVRSNVDRYEYSQVHMGIAVELKLYAPSEAKAETAARAAYARFAELEAIMSDYRRDSELNQLVAKAGQGPVRVSEDLFRVLQRAQEVARLSGGAFDITAGPVIRLWRQARQTGRLPLRSEVLAAKATVGWQSLRLDAATRTAALQRPGITLDLGGIAKGYACDEAIEALRAHGVARALVAAGGDIAASGPPPGESGWKLSVRGWRDPLVLANAAVSTSGDTEQYLQFGARRFSHIVDPRTGYGLTDRVQVTVIGRRGLDTDPLATALSVTGPERAAPLLTRYGARAVWISAPPDEQEVR